MAKKWTDSTSYSNGGPRIPRAWTLKLGAVSLLVHRHIDFGPDVWLLTCEPWFEKHSLGAVEVETAKSNAIGLVTKALQQATAALGTGTAPPEPPAPTVRLEQLRDLVGAEWRGGGWNLPFYFVDANGEVCARLLPAADWVQHRVRGAELLDRSRKVLDMVQTNEEVRAGAKRKAWSGKMVSAEVSALLQSLRQLP